jgi:putative phosphoesterase
VKIGLISDVHCNLEGLERALELLDDCDEVLCAGDLMYQYRFSNDVLALLQQREVRSILGNHDKTVLYSPGHPLRDSGTIDPFYLDYLAGLPSNLTIKRNGTRIAMFHGSPWDEVDGPNAQYIYAHDQRQLLRLAAVPADIVVLGHTHVPMDVRIGDMRIVNSGSCGESRDGTGTLSCMMLDAETGRLELRRFTLPVAKLVVGGRR